MGTNYGQDLNGEILDRAAIKLKVTGWRAADQAQGILAAIVDSSEDAIAAYTSAGLILTWNRGAAAIFGYSAGEAIGKNVSMLVERPDGLRNFTEHVLQGSAVS